jgi:hypothetical protein
MAYEKPTGEQEESFIPALKRELEAELNQPRFPWGRMLFEHAYSERTIADVRRMGGNFGVVGWVIGVGIFDLLLPIRAVCVVVRWFYWRKNVSV